MINWNDYPNNNTAIPLLFNTVGTGGTAQTIVNGGVGIFIDANTSFLTTGITFTANHGSRTGIHLVNIPSGTITGTNVTCTVFYTSGTIDGVDVTNRLAAAFSVGRYGQAPSNFSGLVIGSDGLIDVNVIKQNGATMPSGDFHQTMKNSLVSAAGSGVTNNLTLASGSVRAYLSGDFTSAMNTSIQTAATTALTSTITISGGLANVNVSRFGNAVVPSGDFTQVMKNSLVTAASSGVTTNLTLASGSVRAYLSGDLTATMKASVNTEVLDVFTIDTFAQPGQGAPTFPMSIATGLGYLVKNWANRKDQTATGYFLYNSDGVTVDHKAPVTGDSSLVTVNAIVTGP